MRALPSLGSVSDQSQALLSVEVLELTKILMFELSYNLIDLFDSVAEEEVG